jgi:hypothetical protein
MPPASQAEAYANAHHPHPNKNNKGRPLLDWARRLVNRRATLPGETDQHQQHPSASQIQAQKNQRNNPYPSMAVQRPTSTIQSSFMSRSDSQISRQTGYTGRDGPDDNASTRPIAPSRPPSPSASPSNTLSRTVSNAPSASLLSPTPLKRNSASTASLSTKSTKPTTIISYDSGPHIGYIAQAPTPTAGSSTARTFPQANNPNPHAVPDDNASTLTLASSTLPPARRPLVASPSVTWAPDTSDNLSATYAPSGFSTMKPRMDKDASVRAVRGRRDSWGSQESKWSWKPVERDLGVVI